MSNQPHPQDAIGARDLRSEATAIAERASHKTETTATTTGQTPGIEQTMYLTIAEVELLTTPYYQVSTYYPSAQMLFQVIGELDALMASNRRWGPEMMRWTPLHTRLYYGTLFYIQTLRAMQTCGLATSSHRNLLEEFLGLYPPESLPIVGPLLPFFKGLCACDPPLQNFGLISPRLPVNTGMVVAENGALPALTRILFPNINGIRNGIITTRLAPPAQGVHAWDRAFSTPQAGVPAIAIAHDTANQLSRDARIMPGSIRDIFMEDSALRRYASYPGHVQIPAQVAPALNQTWTHYLGFDTDFSWFEGLVGQMQRYAHHFKGSSTLAACSPRNGPAGLVFVTQQVAYPNRNAHRGTDINSVNLTAFAQTIALDIGRPADKCGLFTQLNWKPAPNFHPTVDTIGDVGVTRQGPIWDHIGEQRRSGIYNPVARLSQVISDHVFVDRPDARQ